MAAAAPAGHSDAVRHCRLWLVVGVLYLITQETRLVFQAGRTLGAARPPFPVRTNRPAAFRRRPAVRLGDAKPGSDEGTWGCSCTETPRRSRRRRTSHTTASSGTLASTCWPRSITVCRARRRTDRGVARIRCARGVRLPAHGTPGSPVAHRDLRLVAGIPRWRWGSLQKLKKRPSSSKGLRHRLSTSTGGATRCFPFVC